MKPKRHIKKFYDLIHKLNMDGHIDAPDKYAAIKDVELAVHKLRQAFEIRERWNRTNGNNLKFKLNFSDFITLYILTICKKVQRFLLTER